MLPCEEIVNSEFLCVLYYHNLRLTDNRPQNSFLDNHNEMISYKNRLTSFNFFKFKIYQLKLIDFSITIWNYKFKKSLET